MSITTRENCTNLELAFSALAGNFAPAQPSLQYALTGGAPSIAQPQKVHVNRTTVARTYTVAMAPGQQAPAGTYATAGGTPIMVQLLLSPRNWLPRQPIRTAPLDVTVDVLPACRLDPPSAASVDLSAAIINGTANPNLASTIVFPFAVCSSPARVRLTGSALRPIGLVTPRAGFDDFINWRAQATFGTSKAALITAGAAPAMALSPTRNQGSGLGNAGSVALSISLVAGNQIVAGGYTGTLTVAIDPSF